MRELKLAIGVAATLLAAGCGDGGTDPEPPPQPNRPPAVSGSIPEQTVPVGGSVTVSVASAFNDPDGDALTYAATSSAPGVASVTMSGSDLTVTGVSAGTATITATATDPDGLSAQLGFGVTVPNRAPEATDSIPDMEVFVGDTTAVDASEHFDDPDGDTLTFAASTSDAAVAAVAVTGSTVSVAALAQGSATVTVTVTDPDGLSAQLGFGVTVPNRAPVAVDSIPGRDVALGDTASIGLGAYFTDPDGDALVFRANSSNPGTVAAFVVADTVRVAALGKGLVTVTVTATDAEGLTAQQSFPVTVPNRAPVVVDSITDLDLPVGERAVVDLSRHFADPDGDALAHAATVTDPQKVGAAVRAGVLELVAYAQGTVTVGVEATDPEGLSATLTFQVTVPNRAPRSFRRVPNMQLSPGEVAGTSLGSLFVDPDGDLLSFAAASSNAGVATATVSDTSVVVAALAPGFTTVTLTATDPGGLSAASSFDVTVETSSPRGFHIELVFATPVTRAQEAVFVRAAERWMTILAPTELEDLAPRTRGCERGPKLERHAAIDDVMIVTVVEEIDGSGRVLAVAGPCWTRVAGGLPSYGFMRFDAADLDRLERIGALHDLVLHEMGHVLGFGTFVWEDFGLLRNTASGKTSPDTHFSGPLAIAAFDEAGGTGYTGAKVPVENTGSLGNRNGHWRETVLMDELMTAWLDVDRTNPLSAITIQSLADLGYVVDMTAADSYRLTAGDAARARDPGRLIPYGNDIWRGPIVVEDRDGRIVRVIPGSPGPEN